MTEVRKGQAPGQIERDAVPRALHAIRTAIRRSRPKTGALARLEAIAWDAYQEGRKAPVTRKAGPGFADPDYDLSVDWLEARDRIASGAGRVEATRTRRRACWSSAARRATTAPAPARCRRPSASPQLAREVLEAQRIEADLLDLSLLTSEYGRQIHPCKGCVSTAMPLCHWPCSCYPNHSLEPDQRLDERDLRALGGGARRHHRHADPLVPGAERAEADDRPPGLRRRRQPRPDVARTARSRTRPRRSSSRAGTIRSTWPAAPTASWCMATSPASKASRRALSDWLDWMGLIDAGTQARLDRYIGYYEPYATSHEALDADQAVQEEVAQRRARRRARCGAASRAASACPPMPGFRGHGRSDRDSRACTATYIFLYAC